MQWCDVVRLKVPKDLRCGNLQQNKSFVEIYWW